MNKAIEIFGLACFILAGLLMLSPYFIMAWNGLMEERKR